LPKNGWSGRLATFHTQRNKFCARVIDSASVCENFGVFKRSVARGSLNGEGLTERQRGLTMKKIVTSAIIALATMTAANAADMPLKAVKAKPLPSWWDTLTISGLVEVGGSVNGNNPAVTNFGQLFTDKANSAF
jgi:hypothetical protein